MGENDKAESTGRPNRVGTDSSSSLAVGTRLHEFEVTALIAQGGFSFVYLAFDHSLQRTVALKEYMPSALAVRLGDNSVVARSKHDSSTFEAGLRSFINEARLLARFDHPALLKVYRFWESNGTAYMAMPYYEGVTLKAAVQSQTEQVTERWLKDILAPIVDALETLHAEQCYHRDIAPDNVILLKNGMPLLLDFGAARRIIGDMTQGVTVILKPGYAPVEQYSSDSNVQQGPWTDVYALSAVLYFAVTGKAPPASVARTLKDTMVPLQSVAAERFDQAFLRAIDRGLSVRPADRPQSMSEFRSLLALPSYHQVAQSLGWPVSSPKSVDADPEREVESRPVSGQASTGAGAKALSAGAVHDESASALKPAAKRGGAGASLRWLKAPPVLLFVVLVASGAALLWHLRTDTAGVRSSSEATAETASDTTGIAKRSRDDAAAIVVAEPKRSDVPSATSEGRAEVQTQEDNNDRQRTSPVAEQGTESEAWSIARRGGRIDDYLAYLKDFPEGQFASAAKAELQRLRLNAGNIKGKAASGPVIAREPAAGKRVTTPTTGTQHSAAETTQAVAPSGDKADARADEARQQERLREAAVLEQQKAETDRYKRQTEQLQREKAEAIRQQELNEASRQREQEEATKRQAAKEAADKEAMKRKSPPPFVPSY